MDVFLHADAVDAQIVEVTKRLNDFSLRLLLDFAAAKDDTPQEEHAVFVLVSSYLQET